MGIIFFKFATCLKRLKHTVNALIWLLAGLYLGIAIFVNIPVAQSFIGSQVASALAQKLGTKVWVGRVDLGLLNRVVIDDVRLLDQQGKEMLRATRLSAKLDYVALMEGRISVTSAQLFGLKARLCQATADARPNYQFVLDSLASKDTTRHTPLDLEINSLVIRHGEVSYDRLDQPARPGLDLHHLHVSNISAHLILNALRDDSVNLNVRKIALREASGLDVRQLTLRLAANRRTARLHDFVLEMPATRLSLSDITATYQMDGKQLELPTLQYNGSILQSVVTPTDAAALLPQLGKFTRPVVLRAAFSGTSTSFRLNRLEAAMPKPGRQPGLQAAADIRIDVSGSVSSWNSKPRWAATIAEFSIDKAGLEMLAGSIPDVAARLENISYRGTAGGYGRDLATKGVLRSGAGNARVALGMHADNFSGRLETDGLNLAQLLANDKFGQLATHISVDGNLKQKRYRAKGSVTRMDYNAYAYRNLSVDGTFDNGLLNGKLSIDDENIAAEFTGKLNANTGKTAADFTANVTRLRPNALHLLQGRLGEAVYRADIAASFTGDNLNTARGKVAVRRFAMRSPESEYTLDSLLLQAGNDARGHYLTLQSDFADAAVTGRFDYATIIQSVKNTIASKLPSIQQLTPIKYRATRGNNFDLQATVRRTDWLRQFFGIDLALARPLRLNGSMDSRSAHMEANLQVPDISYGGGHYKDVSVVVSSPNQQLCADIQLTKMGDDGIGADYRLEASAHDDQLASVFSLDNHARKQRLRGKLNAVVQFARGRNGQAEAHVGIASSQLNVGDTVFAIHPATIIYSRQRLEVNDFAVTSGRQHIRIDGVTTREGDDSLLVDLNGVNVSYILDLVNFHAVEFSGYASGRAYVSRLFSRPEARGRLRVDDFRFENGRLGTLHAQVGWDREKEQIDIDAQAVDTMHSGGPLPRPRLTTINGYVSPKRNYIDLGIEADNTRGEFVRSFCSSFMNRADIDARGQLRLWGDLNKLNLTGEMVANGRMGLSPLNVEYTLRNDTIRCLVNEIRFAGDTILDRNGNVGVVRGSLRHQHLSRLTYDLKATARHLLAYDWAGGSSFYGTVYGTGEVAIKGKSGEVNIDVNLTPERGAQVVYDVSRPEAVGTQEFIHWASRDSLALVPPSGQPAPPAGSDEDAPDEPDIPTDIRLNFLINTTPEATLKLVMDKATGDYINLNGSGTIRAAYYNKGGLDIFGNYLIDHGLYKLTIQNVIKKDFVFAQGGTIVFGGDPYRALLNLKAQYMVNSVSLSDLQIGRSFSNNNIRVNCIMHITGTPGAPRLAFDLDMPTVGADAKQMIYSIINSEEEMNQQVLYLLAIGRFYSQGNNNAAAEGNGGNKTSLAMQSLLSGQISQQLNTVLGSVMKNNNWNFGANISTGDEGWNNAEYEGLLSGRLLNNRLLFDGQFGYRDNANATTSFIGDFDLKYLIFPNGNLSIHVYNQTNDRYFTRSSLNTQGIGFILKHDFNSWRELFRLRRKR